ncbi:hypothetical protein JANAI62_15050 [Jannaschia pagri]|uniref:Response regulatory domain-containing protein n=1 Tax=Jannaschia pagri TaxID=2829797 RepID=A0ABQ4NKD6_9RHOB|nr:MULTISPECIES: response regulator [unclassified Jannaschia]GIT91050.1 hypothetical protein JANAI61_15080 [Jannaschia sp. AI_61]GIT94882.1 hypothetical protein JANAI62_15050 [Jannaschia sp. AI_62]
MDDLDLTARPAPTAQRPLLGTTVLLIEDSRFASEAVRLLALRSGARIRRADCLASARRHLGLYQPGVAIIDLGLPDGPGLSLIEDLATAKRRPLVILGTSGQPRAEAEQSCLAAGADGFLPKPIESLAAFQTLILRHLPRDHWPNGLRPVGSDVISPDRLALCEDLVYAERVLEDPNVGTDYVANFLQGLARTCHDPELLAQSRGLAQTETDETRPKLQALIADRLRETRQVV